MTTDENTSCWLKSSTKKRLMTFGTLDDTFDDVLNRLMDIAEKTKVNKNE